MSVTSLKGEVAVAFDEWRGNPHPWMFESVSNSENMIAVFSSVGKAPLSWLGFRLQFKATLVVIILPYWFLVLVPVAFTSITQVRWKQRFSLRTLLIVTTLLAVALGLIVWLW